MPSPFPGMDLYLEDPQLWPDFHDGLTAAIRDRLNATLPVGFFARLAAREEVNYLGIETPRRIVADVSIQRTGADEKRGGTAVAIAPMAEESVVEVSIVLTTKTNFVEIVDSQKRHVVTVIEILSPWNKTPGHGLDDFRRRRQEILQSQASYIEFDFLRSGDRTWPAPSPLVVADQLKPCPEYVTIISRAWQRRPEFVVRLYPMPIQHALPTVSIPLTRDTAETALDLQAAFHQAYDGGPYRRGAVDYSQPPAVPLPAPLNSWAAGLMQ